MTSPSELWSTNDTQSIIPEHSSATMSPNNWGDNEFVPIDEESTNQKLEEAKRKREERKLMRQKEMEARRASRGTSGPMKLGARKM